MIHFTCDRCRKIIETEHEIRYMVRIEVQATLSDSTNDCDEDRDHLMAIEDIIEQLEDPECAEEISDEIYRRRSYDLCPKCCAIYLQNPLSCEPQPQLGFSNN